MGKLPLNVDGEPFWEIDDGEIKPISYTYVKPQNYIEGYLYIIQWLKDQGINHESGYAFTYQDNEDSENRAVGGINSNNEGITFIQVNGYGKITHEFHKI